MTTADIVTFYTDDTSNEVIKVLEELMISGERVSITFGNICTGKPWTDQPESGYIGRADDWGSPRFPLLIKSKLSTTGEIILTNSILKITAKGGKVLYEGPVH